MGVEVKGLGGEEGRVFGCRGEGAGWRGEEYLGARRCGHAGVGGGVRAGERVSGRASERAGGRAGGEDTYGALGQGELSHNKDVQQLSDGGQMSVAATVGSVVVMSCQHWVEHLVVNRVVVVCRAVVAGMHLGRRPLHLA